MPWPLSQDYNEAIQTPAQCFSDPDLQRGEAVTNALGLPVPCSGNFADVYAVVSGQQKWAVKCFTRQIQGLRERYAEISKYLQQVKLPFMVDFKFQEQGIRVRGQWYPILKMQWVEGQALNTFVKDQLDNPSILRTTSQLWARMGTVLRAANLAHGDLQHGNVLLVPGSKAGTVGLKLVDYDGMCVPALELLKATEVGHPAYQHPQRLREGAYGLHIDRFSHLVIYTALRSLAVGGRGLWERYDNGDNLLFSQKDFENPRGAHAFQELLKLADPEVTKLVQALSASCQKAVDQAPLLDELLAADLGKSQSITQVPGGRTGVRQAAESPFATATTGVQSRRSASKKSGALLALGAGVVVVGTLLAGGFILLSTQGTGEDKSGKAVAQNRPGTTESKKKLPTPPVTEATSPDTKKTLPDTKPVPKETAKIVYLSDLDEEVDLGAAGRRFGKNGTRRDWDGSVSHYEKLLTVDGKGSAKNLFTHPQEGGGQGIVVRYKLQGNYKEFVSEVGCGDSARKEGPASPLRFRVRGDGKVLWESQEITITGQSDKVRVSVAGVHTLELQAVAAGGAGWAHCIWLEPHLIEAGTTPTTQQQTKEAPGGGDLSKSTLVIIKADYGSAQNRVSVTQKLKDLLAGDNFPVITASNDLAGDPHGGAPKWMNVDYQIGGKAHSLRINENDLLIPHCFSEGMAVPGVSKDFVIRAARYGKRSRWAIVTDRAAAVIRNPQTSFAVPGDFINTDPAPGEHKVLVVWFDYNGLRYMRAFPDGRALLLK